MFDRFIARRLDSRERSKNVAGLARLLHHGKPWVVSRAAAALAGIGSPEAVTALTTALTTSTVAEPTANALGQVGTRTAVTTLVDVLLDGEFTGRPEKLRGALHTGVRVLRGGLDDDAVHESTIARVDMQLLEDGAPRPKSPIGAVPAADRGVSMPAVDRLTKLAQAGAYAAALDLLRDIARTAKSVRDSAGLPWPVRTHVVTTAERASATLSRLNLLTNPNTGLPVEDFEEHEMRLELARLSGLMVSLPDDAVADPPPREAVSTPEADATVLDLARRLLRDGDEACRHMAVEWLHQMSGADAAAALREALADAVADVRRNALVALHRMDAIDSVQPLRDASTDADWPLRLAAVAPLGDVEDPAAVEVLRNLLDDELPVVRRAAVSVLASLGGAAGDEALERALRDPHDAVRWRAAHLTAELADPTWAERLAPLLLAAHAPTRKTAASTLQQWGWPADDPEQRAHVAIGCAEWADVEQLGAAAAGPLVRMLTEVYAEGDQDNEEAVATLQRLVAGHGRQLPREVLEAGANLTDPTVLTDAADGDPHLRPIDAGEVRRLCQQALAGTEQ